MFAPNQVELLRAPLDAGRVAHRKKQGQILSYLEGFDVIEAANAIFGFDGWSYLVTRLEQVGTVWYATVRVTVNAGGDLVEREDVGVGLPAAKAGETPSGEAVETAIKASLTDSLKRALRTFGNAFGNGLYDKDAPEHDARPQPPTPSRAAQPSTPPAAADQPLGEVRGPQLATRLRAALGSQGFDPAEQADWITRQIKASGKAGLPAFTLAEGKALLDRANNAAAPVAAQEGSN